MIDEPRNHRVTIRHTVAGDINKTLCVETFDMTATEWERWLDREREALDRRRLKTDPFRQWRSRNGKPSAPPS
jgi:hypothetical protein